MKLAIIRKQYTPFGGAERFIQALARHLATQGVSITLVSSAWNGPFVSGVRWMKADAGGLTRFGRDRSFEKSVKKVLSENRFDIIQSHERIVGADIYRLGDGIHQGWLDRYRRDLPAWRRLLSMADPFHRQKVSVEAVISRDPKVHFVANSQLVRDELKAYYQVSEQQISVIRNGVDTNYFRPPSDNERRSCRDRMGIDANALLVSAIGSGYRRKGFFELVRSFADLPELTLCIAGKDKLEESLKQLINQMHLSKRIRVLGATHDVRSIYWASDVFCLPSLYDPSSNAVLEALSAGLPVVTTANVGTAFEINQSGAGVICLRNSESIRIAIEHAFAQRAKMSKQARTLAQGFSQEEAVKEWLSLYQQTIRNRAGAHHAQ
jgi:UDP-glucose:(heptosyl)LPS alpha-1,3-glucosyltransferase